MAEKIKQKHLREIVQTLLHTKNLTRKKAWKITKSVSKKYDLEDIPTNVQILEACDEKEGHKLNPYLQTKPIRTASGVTVITVVPRAADCPGDCIYCPKGEDSPKSYIGTEPAIMRARHNEYNPFAQAKNRLEQYWVMGHPTDKVQIIIIGGTFLALDPNYKKNFIKRIFDALNQRESKTLEDAKKINETTDNRCIGLIIETRPDFCKKAHIKEMLNYGTTMVEIGVQSIYPKVIRKINRMHSLSDVKDATSLAKDSGLKVNYHIMPGLPGVGYDEDIAQFKELFENPDFRPDALKIYPTLVVKGTRLYDWWKAGKYEPLTTKKATILLAEAMKHIPKYCRIVRVQRTMAAGEIEAGVKKSNLRQLVENKAKKKSIIIKEIRHREVGHSNRVDYEKTKLMRMGYKASKGKEIFLSFEDEKNDVLIGFVRLRVPFKPFRPEITKKTALVRELHVYGPLVPIGDFNEDASQHRGFGSRLLSEAERIAKEEFNRNKIVITSGVGAREYYYKNGYKPDGVFVSKVIG